MSNPSTHQLLSRLMVEKVFNQGDLDLLNLLMAPDAINHQFEMFGPAYARGPQPVREFTEIFRFAFPDLQATVVDQISDGDRVATRWKLEGTQSGRLMGIEASHRFMSVEGIRIDRIVNGKIVETWNQLDSMSMLRQLGALPTLERRPAAASASVSVAA